MFIKKQNVLEYWWAILKVAGRRLIDFRHQPTHTKHNLSKQHQKTYFVWCVLFIILVFVSALDRLLPLNLPEHNKLFARVVVDENNRPLRTFADKDGIWRYPIALEDVSPLYIEALLTYEDRWFWIHPGVNPIAILRAAYLNIKHGRIVSGGSTISMQVARILHPHRRSFWGKLQQVFRTMQLEWHLTKREILQIYLNTAPFGGTIEGVEAASYTYLNKSAKQLSHSEAALLAVLPQAPTRFRPDSHNLAAQHARDKVLNRLVTFGVWSQEVVNDAKLEQVFSFNFKPRQLAPLLARRLLTFSDGQSVVRSTINSELQQNLQDALSSYMRGMPKQSSAAILVVDNQTSAVKAYIGTAEFGNPQRFGYVDMVQAIRSPGSTLKPFLYGLAMDEGLIHSHSLLADVPRTWGRYQPGNFSGAFSGPVTAAEALQRSLNMPAVDLLERVGVNRFAAHLQNAGLDLSLVNNKPNLSMILGGVGLSLESLVTGYRSLANQGQVQPLQYLVNDLQATQPSRPMFSPASAWVIKKILADIDRPNGIHSSAAKIESNKLAWKTGTSYGFRDSWAIGVNANYTIGVWVGRPDGTAMPGHYGRQTAGPLLFLVADQLTGDITLDDRIRQTKQPENVSQQNICWPIGQAMESADASFCHQKHQAWIIDNVIPPTWHIADADTWQNGIFTFWVDDKSNKRVVMDCVNSQAAFSRTQRRVAVWPKVLEPWLAAKYRRTSVIPNMAEPCVTSTVTASATLKLVGLHNGSIYRKSGANGQLPSVWLRSLGGSGDKNWYINGELVYKTKGGSAIEHIFTTPGRQQIVVQDQLGNTDLVTIEVQL